MLTKADREFGTIITRLIGKDDLSRNEAHDALSLDSRE